MVHERNLQISLDFRNTLIQIFYISLIINMKSYWPYMHVFVCSNETWMNGRKLGARFVGFGLLDKKELV